MKELAILTVRRNIEDFQDKCYMKDLDKIHNETRGMIDVLEKINVITFNEYCELQQEIMIAYVDTRIEIEG